jgi:hypothetical protein
LRSGGSSGRRSGKRQSGKSSSRVFFALAASSLRPGRSLAAAASSLRSLARSSLLDDGVDDASGLLEEDDGLSLLEGRVDLHEGAVTASADERD